MHEVNDHGDGSDDTNGDGEGVWSPDIEQCFREALLLFPPCGRRKHILQEEGGGKMYGRNELIARHIMMRTGKSRTRKQVSSHIQVLARRKAKAEAANAASNVTPSPSGLRAQSANRNEDHSQQSTGYYDVWTDRPIVTQRIRLVEFSAFTEHRGFQESSPMIAAPDASHVQQAPPSVGNSSSALTMNSGLARNIDPDMKLETGSSTYSYSTPMESIHAPATITHPLASNHHLPAQFNQASYQTPSPISTANQQLNPKSLSQHNLTTRCASLSNNHTNNNCQVQLQHHQAAPSSGLTRHSYIRIDYRHNARKQTDKLERIDIAQIQDKFPEIGGSEGLYQRGPSDAFFLIKFWADLNNDYEYNVEDQNSFFGFSSHFETIEPYKDITCSTKACSYGLQVVEKVEKVYGAFNSSNGRYSYDINRSPMCEFMIQFIKKLRQLPRASQMNSVLENFTVLQVITSGSTSEILLCLAYVFEVASPEQNNIGPQHHVYKLTAD